VPPADPPPEWLLRARLATGDLIRNARKRARISQEALAELVQVERRTIVRIELGITSPPLDRLFEIARALDVSPRELLPDEVPRPPTRG
jgi:transcriptional regulator with XRE-family HTH domain